MFLLFCYDSALVENWFIWPTQKINFYHKKFLYLPEVNQIFKRKNSPHTFERTDKQKKFYQKFFLILSRKSIFQTKKFFMLFWKKHSPGPQTFPRPQKEISTQKNSYTFPENLLNLSGKTIFSK